jgi:ATP-dependent HslUV protease subunit HslV
MQAELLVADATTTLTVAGNGDVLEPHDGVMAIGSGSPYAVAAARALVDVPGLDAADIALRAMKIAASM